MRKMLCKTRFPTLIGRGDVPSGASRRSAVPRVLPGPAVGQAIVRRCVKIIDYAVPAGDLLEARTHPVDLIAWVWSLARSLLTYLT